MKQKQLTLDVNQIAKKSSTTITIRLTGFYKFRIRLWIVMKLLRVAIFISPVRMTVVNDDEI